MATCRISHDVSDDTNPNTGHIGLQGQKPVCACTFCSAVLSYYLISLVQWTRKMAYIIFPRQVLNPERLASEEGLVYGFVFYTYM